MEQTDPLRPAGDSGDRDSDLQSSVASTPDSTHESGPDDSPDDSPDGDLASIEGMIAGQEAAEERDGHVEELPSEQKGVELPAFPVVGIGASAGGLRALQRLFDVMPGDTGMAFVVVVHLSPEHESHLGPLLQGHASMPIITVRETTRIEPNAAYVIPPGSNLSSVDSHLRLDPQEAQRSARAH